MKYSALSSDQTPFRKDERERLKLRGARIFTIDQIDGHEPIHENWGNDGETGDEIDEASSDPPRVWDKTLEKPGCAFTRSIGDSVAESIGVFAEPEVLTWELQPNDKFAIIASDGVFEFLPNQDVVDMVGRFTDSIEAGKHVVAEAYRLWLQNDERTDDITIMIINFEMMRQRQGVAMASHMCPRNQGMSEAAEQARPVRKVMSKARRKDISENFDNTSDEVEYDFEANASPKTPAELERVAAMVKTNFMFQHLTSQQKDQIFAVMTLRNVVEDELVIREGDAGDEMYIIDEGEFSVLKKNGEGVSQLVFTYTSIGAAFGELSLMYGKPRAASIKAKTDGKLWVLGRQAFRAVLMKKKPEGMLNLFKCVPVLKGIEVSKLHRLCEKANLEEYKDGDLVVKQKPVFTSEDFDDDDEHDVGGNSVGLKKKQDGPDWIVGMVMSGCLGVVTIDTTGMSKSPRKHMREEGTYIVSMELGMTIDHIVAEGRTKVAYIRRADFDDILGHAAVQDLQQMISVPKHRGKPLKRKNSFVSDPKFIECPRTKLPRSAFSCELTTLAVGDFAYIGTFNSSMPTDPTFSAKVIFKKKAQDARMDVRLLLERRILTAAATLTAGKTSNCLAKLISIAQDEYVVMMNYSEVFVCDLGLAISQNVLQEEAKTYYAACLCSAVFTMHNLGVMHRFINPGSIYMSTKGIPKLADLRYAKKFDGQKAYTVCGDPMYFAPEIVKQQGYDYGVDLWALGCVIFELFEGVSPLGSHDMEETQVFKKITAFEPDALEFTKASHKKVRSIISDLMKTECSRRCGYKTQDDLKTKKVFNKINFTTVGSDQEFPIELLSHIDASSLPSELQLEICSNENFDAF